MSLWSVVSAGPSSQGNAGFLFFTSEEIDFAGTSSFSILVSELNSISNSANVEVYADIPLRRTGGNGQAFFALQTPSKASNLDVLNVFSQQDMNRFNGTNKIVHLDSYRISYVVITVPKDNVTNFLSLHMRFQWMDFSKKTSIGQYNFVASFDTSFPSFFDNVLPSLAITGQGNILIPETVSVYRFSFAYPRTEKLTEIMPTADNIVFNGSNVWLLWDVNTRSDSTRFVSTAISLEVDNQNERTLYDLSLTFSIFLIGIGLPLVISSSLEYGKSVQSSEIKFGILKKPAFCLLLLVGTAIAVFEVLRFFSFLDLFGSLHGFYILLFEIAFYLLLGFWLGEAGLASASTSAMMIFFIFFDNTLYFRLIMDIAIAGTITTMSFVLGELVFILKPHIEKAVRNALSENIHERGHVVEIYGSLLNAREWNGSLSKGSHREIGKEKRVGWKLSFDKLSSRRNEAVLNLVKTGNARDVYYTTLFEVGDEVYEALLQREMGKTTCEKWKKREPIPDTSYRPIELDTKIGKSTIFIIPEAGRVTTPTSGKTRYVKAVKKGIEGLYHGEMRETNLNALKRAIEESIVQLKE
jgi:hypothetical protein